MLKTQKGFTLIELLVVVSIIGMLSTIVLASLNNARGKGADATIKSSLNNMRGQAELFYTNNSDTYGTAYAEGNCGSAGAGTLFADANISKGWTAALNAVGGAASNAICSSSTSAYAIAVALKFQTGYAWCIDSTGNTKAFNGTPAAAITTNACT